MPSRAGTLLSLQNSPILILPIRAPLVAITLEFLRKFRLRQYRASGPCPQCLTRLCAGPDGAVRERRQRTDSVPGRFENKREILGG